MRQRDFYILGLGCGGLLFSILTLVAGCRRGTMDNYAIAGVYYFLPSSRLKSAKTSQYSYDLADGVVYPPLNATNSTIEYGVGPYASLIGNDIHWWFFTVHYLSLCGGYVGGTESPDYVFLQCERKAAGWRFRTDDPFIVHFLSFDEKPPVNSTVSLETFTTAPPIGTLATGIAFSVLSVGFLTAEAIGGWSKFGRLAQTSVWLLAVRKALV